MTKLTREQLDAYPAHPIELTATQYDALVETAERVLELEEPKTEEQAALERLGRWLAADHERTWRPFDNGATVDLYSRGKVVGFGAAQHGGPLHVALNKALDAAEEGK